MSVDTAPSVDEQRRIISSLVLKPTNPCCVARTAYNYQAFGFFVATEWYKKWQRYVGYETQQTPVDSDYPGKLTMHRNQSVADFFYNLQMQQANGSRNTLVHECIWCKWVQWYGVADSHELDRCCIRTPYLQAFFGICLLNQNGKLVKKPRRMLHITEECGYIELQLRRIFGVTTDRKTKLWVCEKSTDDRFLQVLDRSKPINSICRELSAHLEPPQNTNVTSQQIQPNARSVSSKYRQIFICIVVYILRLFCYVDCMDISDTGSLHL